MGATTSHIAQKRQSLRNCGSWGGVRIVAVDEAGVPMNDIVSSYKKQINLYTSLGVYSYYHGS